MKNILIVLMGITILVIVFFIGKGCSTDDITQTVVDELKEQTEIEKVKVRLLERDKAVLFAVVDSLRNIPPEIDKQIIYLQAEVDSSIAQDSLNAISEYRAGLRLLTIRTETTNDPCAYFKGNRYGSINLPGNTRNAVKNTSFI
jgi:hypothetical protein